MTADHDIDLAQAQRAATDLAVLTVRRAAVTMFLAADPDTQRRAIEAATDDPAAIALAMRILSDGSEPDQGGCRCCR